MAILFSVWLEKVKLQSNSGPAKAGGTERTTTMVFLRDKYLMLCV